MVLFNVLESASSVESYGALNTRFPLSDFLIKVGGYLKLVSKVCSVLEFKTK